MIISNPDYAGSISSTPGSDPQALTENQQQGPKKCHHDHTSGGIFIAPAIKIPQQQQISECCNHIQAVWFVADQHGPIRPAGQCESQQGHDQTQGSAHKEIICS